MKISSVMLSVFLFLTAFVCCGAPDAKAEVNAEEKLDSVSIDSLEIKGLPVASALSQLQAKIKDSGVIISSRIPGKFSKKLSLKLEKKTLRESLNTIAARGFTWSVSGRVIVFIPADVEYQLDNIRIGNFFLDSCPVNTALMELKKRTGKPGVNIRSNIPANMERGITLSIKKAKTLRAILAEFGRYGYVWSKNKGNKKQINVYPVGNVKEWRSGFGTLKISFQDARWVNTTRIVGAKFDNVPFAEVEKFLRSKKIAVGSVGRTPVRVTFAAGRVTLKQFLTAVCLASGFDCEVKNKRVTFRKGPAIGFYLADTVLRQQLVKRKFPVIRKPVTLAEFVQKADPSTAWVLFHAPRINMKNVKFSVTPDISGNTMPDALDLLQKTLYLRVLYTSGVVALVPDHNKARYAFFNRMRTPVSGFTFNNATFAQILADIQKKALESDRTRQGTPIIPAVKLTTKKISMNLSETTSDELLRRLNLALGYYGYISLCGTHYVLVSSPLFKVKGVTITQFEPFVLPEIISGAAFLDVPLDFQSIAFNNMTVEKILKFIKSLCDARFSGAGSIRWAVSSQDILKKPLTFSVEQPTLRSIIDALSVRAGLSAKFDIKSIFITEARY